MFQPLNRAYNNRIGPQINRLLKAGIFVLFSDLGTTPDAANEVAAGSEVLGPILSDKTFQLTAQDVAQVRAIRKISEKHR